MYAFDLNAPFNLKIDEIQKNEFVYFKPSLDTHLDDESIDTILDSLTKKTGRLFFSLDGLEKFPRIGEHESKYPVRWFGVPVFVGSNQSGVKSNQTVYSNIDPLSLNIFESQKNKFINQEKVIPEFVLSENHYQLGPTIIEFFKRYKLPFAFIRIEGRPTEQAVGYYREVFESLRLNGFKEKVYFSFNNPHLDEWNIKTYNTFSGLSAVAIDLSNKCTHSCVFCGLWGPEFIDEMKSKNKNNVLPSEMANLLNLQMPYVKAIDILESLPDTIKSVQFGGAGDPLTHPQWLDIISSWRSRGVALEVLTNFEYPTHEEIDVLHSLSKGRRFDFMVNVSAATPETYKIVRPRQSTAIFEKVISNIRYSKNLKNRDGHGIRFTMIHVMNKHNFREAVEMVELAHELGASVWLKPLEVHSINHQKYSIEKEDLFLFQKTMASALKRADELEVKIILRNYIEAIIKDVSFEDKLSPSKFDLGVINGHIPADLYQTTPCTIGFTYARFEVDGGVKPCCGTPLVLGDNNKSIFKDVWHSNEYYTWRSKFLRIQNTHFHLKDKEFGFCQMCPHTPINIESAKLLSNEWG